MLYTNLILILMMSSSFGWARVPSHRLGSLAPKDARTEVVQIESDPTSVAVGCVKNLKLTCDVGKPASTNLNITNVNSITIWKDMPSGPHAKVAEVDREDPNRVIKYPECSNCSQDFQGAEFDWKVWQGNDTGHLTLNVPSPNKTHLGTYICDATVTVTRESGRTYTIDYDDIQYVVQEIDPTLDCIMKKLKEAKEDRANMTKQIENLKAEISTEVSFSAVRDNGKDYFYEDVSSDTVLVFNKAFINIGGGFNTSTGVFTCPVAGRYYVRYDLQVLWNPNLTTDSVVYLLLNGAQVTMSRMWDSSTASHAWGVIGAGLVLQLELGDEVKVRTGRNSRFYWRFDYGYACMFTGYLLK